MLASRNAKRCLLALEDEGRMAVALTAAARAGCEIVLPASLAPRHVSALFVGADTLLSNQAALRGFDMLDPLEPVASGGGALPAMPLDLAGVAVTIHTSGSTGAHVAVSRPLAVLAAEIATLEATFTPTATAVLGSVPPCHIYGLLFRVLWPLAVGRTIVAGIMRYPNELVRAADDHAGAIFVSSPAFLKRAVPALDSAALGRSLSVVFSSGGPLDPTIAARWNGAGGAPLVEVYGSTETGGIAHRRVLDSAAPPPWSCLAGVRIRRDEQTKQFLLRSPHQAGTGETLCPDLIGDMLPDGRFTLLGRVDRIVKIEENRVSLNEVEGVLAAMSEVEAVKVLPLTRAERTSLAAVVVPSRLGWEAFNDQGRRATVAMLTGRLRVALSVAALPRRWRFVRVLPENAQGKTTAASLEALFSPCLNRVTEPERLGVTTEGDAVIVTLRVQPELCYFDGHFADAPILPGVVQVDWAVREAKTQFSIDRPLLRLEAVKFFRVASPDTLLRLTLCRNRALFHSQASDKIAFEYASGAGLHSSGRIVFSDDLEGAA
jgi:acyl-coenzyme A synthetase/AMP-(fatty) acid ligase